MDQKYEFAAPQYVDFNNLMDNDREVDEFFNVDMESGEEWVSSANNTFTRNDINEARQPEPGAKALLAPSSVKTNQSNANPSQNHPRKPPSNMVTSWGPGPVMRMFRGCSNPPVPTKVSNKVPLGKVGRADLQATVQAVLGNTKNTPRYLHRTPSRQGVGNNTRVLGCTPKRLGTNSQAPRLSVSRPRTQVQRSLNSPSASRVRRKSKSPAAVPVPILSPTTPDIVRRFKNSLLGNDLHQVQSVQGQPSSLFQPKARAKYRSQAEQIKTYQHSTPSRFRSRSRPPLPPKSAPAVSSRQIAPAPGPSQLGARPKSSKPREASNPKGAASKKATVVETLSRVDTKYKLKDGSKTNSSSHGVFKSTVTIPDPFHFTTNVRAEERDKFENNLRKKETAAEEKKRLEHEKKEMEKKAVLLKERKALVHKPEPVRYFKPLVIKKSEKMLTNPVTPKLGPKRIFHKIDDKSN